jgi:folylpolyglutamate synthase/dihydrofolate synthase
MGQRDDIYQTSSLNDLLNFLFSFKRAEKSGLEAMRSLDEKLKQPHHRFRSIHVAGTNGKGSVCHKIAAALQAEGFKVGLYTSPHLNSFCERIRVDGQMIPEEAVLRLLPPIMDLGEGSFFDYTTALAFTYFAEQKAQIAAIETGIGGRFDSTNVITPILSIITSVDYDHMHLLGNTLQEIVHEKAGIIKPGVPYLLGPQVPFLEGERAPSSQTGFYDEENSLIAKKALEMLNISKTSIESGIATRPPCRFEVVHEKFLLDVAHNPDGIVKLIQALHLHFPRKKLHFFVNFSVDKDAASCLRLLSEAGSITCVGGENPRLFTADQLADLALSLGIKVFKKESFCFDGLDDDLFIVCGSFYLMAEARQAIASHESSQAFTLYRSRY